MKRQTLLQRLEQRLPTERLSRDWLQTPCGFILSTGRTGTDSARHLFARVPEAVSHHEPQPDFLDHRQRALDSAWRKDPWLDACFIRCRRRLVREAARAGKTYVESSSRITFFAPVVQRLMPNARFVFSFRHPGEYVRSGMRRQWYSGHPNDRFKPHPPPDDPARNKWDGWSPFQRLCWLWSATNAFALRFCDQVPTGIVMPLPFEVLVQDFAAAAESMIRHFGLQPPPRDQMVEVGEARHNAQTDNDFPNWPDWSREQTDQALEIAGGTMRALGYSFGSTPFDPGSCRVLKASNAEVPRAV